MSDVAIAAERTERIRVKLQGLTPERREWFIQRLATTNGYSVEQAADYVARAANGEMFKEIERLEAELEVLNKQLARVRAFKNLYVPPNKPWMWALEMKVVALKIMELFSNDAGLATEARGFALDQKRMLNGAEAYSWSADAATAAHLASRSISEDTLPVEVVVPGMAGWWWFLEPLPIRTTPNDGEGLSALLWSKRENGIEFSTFVLGKEGIATSLGWVWDPGMSWAAMMAEIADQKFLLRRQSDLPVGDAQAAIGQVSRLFLAGCVWLNQKVAAVESGHVERHRRKQIARENPGVEVHPEIRVVQLRKRETSGTHAPSEAGEGAPVEWSCRWVVSGHWRNQFYRSTGERKLVYIMPFVKGPADKPFKPVAQTVYEVNR